MCILGKYTFDPYFVEKYIYIYIYMSKNSLYWIYYDPYFFADICQKGNNIILYKNKKKENTLLICFKENSSPIWKQNRKEGYK
jgi:hypothetical protein